MRTGLVDIRINTIYLGRVRWFLYKDGISCKLRGDLRRVNRCWDCNKTSLHNDFDRYLEKCLSIYNLKEKCHFMD